MTRVSFFTYAFSGCCLVLSKNNSGCSVTSLCCPHRHNRLCLHLMLLSVCVYPCLVICVSVCVSLCVSWYCVVLAEHLDCLLMLPSQVLPDDDDVISYQLTSLLLLTEAPHTYVIEEMLDICFFQDPQFRKPAAIKWLDVMERGRSVFLFLCNKFVSLWLHNDTKSCGCGAETLPVKKLLLWWTLTIGAKNSQVSFLSGFCHCCWQFWSKVTRALLLQRVRVPVN